MPHHLPPFPDFLIYRPPRPPLSNSDSSQYLHYFMFQSPQFPTSDDSQNPRHFIFQSPNVEPKSPTGSTTDCSKL